MEKPIIAIDIDDVLAANAAGFVEWSNRKYGTNLTVDDYQEHWAEMWKVEFEEALQRSDEFHTAGPVGSYEVIHGAKETLHELKEKYRLVLLTSRRTGLTTLTKEWIDKYYPDIFDDCVFAGFYDARNFSGLHMTKGALAKEINASYLIDDQLKHVEAAAEAGITALLFGEYSWNKRDELPPNITRVKDWSDIAEYFK